MPELRNWKGAALNFGLEWHAFANSKLPKTLAEREGVNPCIPFLPGQSLRGFQPIERLAAFLDGKERLPSLLSKHYPGTPDAHDLIYVGYATEVEMIGIAAWLEGLSAAQRPAVAFNYHYPSHEWKPDADGMGIVGDAHRWIYAMQRLRAVSNRVRYFAGIPGLAKALSKFLNATVHTLPHATHITQGDLMPSGAKKHDVGFLSTRMEQGLQLLPGILRELSLRKPGLRVFLKKPPGKEGTKLVSEIRSQIPDLRITMDTDVYQSSENFSRYISECRVLCFPYLRSAYALRSSGIFNESNMIGTPSVVPEGTPMGRAVAEGSAAGVVYGREHPADIANAVMTALTCEENLRHRAEQLADQWRQHHDGTNILQTLIRSFDDHE